PDITTRGGDNPLHQAESATEVDTLRRRQRLTILVEYGDRLASIGTEPGVVFRVDRRTEGATFHPTAGKSDSERRDRMAIRVELGCVALPERVLRLPADREVVTDPEVAFAVEHCLATSAVTSAVELERQHPCAGRETKVRHEGNLAHLVGGRDWIKLRDQREQL